MCNNEVLLSSWSSSSVRLSVSCDGWREGWQLSCSHTVPVPVLERDMVARLRRYAEVDVPTVLMDVLPWYAATTTTMLLLFVF